MAYSEDVVTERFLRTYCKLFTARDMGKFLLKMGIHASCRETEDFLQTHPLVFPLEKDFFITRAGAFTKELFSIKPSAFEFEKGIFIAGDRCLPFVDSEMLSSSLDFYFRGQKLPKKIVPIDSDLAIDLYLLFGEEYAPQYIAADPANKDLDISENEFALPVTVNLTAVDISVLKEKFGFTKEDRLLCSVSDWDTGKIDLCILHESDDNDPFDKGQSGEVRLHWYKMLEQLLLESFDKLGPCSTIEEQLADVFFEHRAELCIPECGSVEEFLKSHTKKIAMEFFGVETRLWKKGEIIPAVGKWNKAQLDVAGQTLSDFNRENDVLCFMPDFVFDQYIVDMFYHKQDDVTALVERLFPKEFRLAAGEKKYILLHLAERNAILRRTYNWFADQTIGPVRERALALYERVARLVYRIDCTGNSLEKFPQQELVILSQLYSNITRILESIATNDHFEKDADASLLSLEGMEMNFEDIEDELEYAVDKQQCKKFTVIK